ncbi:hypothetical protein D3C83_245380 [compost metagenome]
MTPALANPIPKSIPDAVNRTARLGEKNPIGPITVERTKRIRIQRGNVFELQEAITNRSRPIANIRAPAG